MMEDLRSKCVYKISSEEDVFFDRWWRYMKKIHTECKSLLNEGCSKIAHEYAGLDYSKT